MRMKRDEKSSSSRNICYILLSSLRTTHELTSPLADLAHCSNSFQEWTRRETWLVSMLRPSKQREEMKFDLNESIRGKTSDDGLEESIIARKVSFSSRSLLFTSLKINPTELSLCFQHRISVDVHKLTNVTL